MDTAESSVRAQAVKNFTIQYFRVIGSCIRGDVASEDSFRVVTSASRVTFLFVGIGAVGLGHCKAMTVTGHCPVLDVKGSDWDNGGTHDRYWHF